MPGYLQDRNNNDDIPFWMKVSIILGLMASIGCLIALIWVIKEVEKVFTA